MIVSNVSAHWRYGMAFFSIRYEIVTIQGVSEGKIQSALRKIGKVKEYS